MKLTMEQMITLHNIREAATPTEAEAIFAELLEKTLAAQIKAENLAYQQQAIIEGYEEDVQELTARIEELEDELPPPGVPLIE